jgi:hypothetical protein
MFNGLSSFINSRKYDPLTRILFIIGGAVGVYVSYLFSVRGFGTQIPDNEKIAKLIVIFFISLQLYVNRNVAAQDRILALIIAGLCSYVYGIWTNITGILSFSGMTIDMIGSHNWYKMIIPVMVGFPLEVAPEALIVIGFFPEQQTVISDAIRGIGSALEGLFGDSGRPSVQQMRNRPRQAQPSRNPANPRWQNQPAIRPAQTGQREEPTYRDLMNELGEELED